MELNALPDSITSQNYHEALALLESIIEQDDELLMAVQSKPVSKLFTMINDFEQAQGF